MATYLKSAIHVGVMYSPRPPLSENYIQVLSHPIKVFL